MVELKIETTVNLWERVIYILLTDTNYLGFYFLTTL